MSFRSEYSSVITAVEAAGFHVTGMPLDSGGDRIVCAGQVMEYGLTGNSFWLAERNGRWFLGTWGGLLYRIPSSVSAAKVSIAWLRQQSTQTVSDIPEELKSEFSLMPADDDEFDAEQHKSR